MRPLLFTLGILWAGAASAQNILTAQNAASGGTGIPANGFAPGSLITIQVRGSGSVIIDPDVSQVSVRLRPRTGGSEVEARVLSASLGSYLTLIPAGVPAGVYDLLLTTPGQTSLPLAIEIVPIAFGLFVRGRAGIGPALVQNVSSGKDPTLNLFTDPARPGDYLTLWGTGLGNAGAGGITVEIAGIPVSPDYAGQSPEYPGVDQINVALPPETPDSCFVSVRVLVGDSISNESTFAYSSEGAPCKDPFGFSATELEALDEGRSVRLGVVSLRSEVSRGPTPQTSPPYVRNEAVSAEFSKRDAESVALLAQPLVVDDRYFSCQLQSPVVVPILVFADNFDAGESLRLEGPGKSLDVPHPGIPILYFATLDPKDLSEDSFFSPGPWTIQAPGGQTVAPFQATRQIPPPLRWTNRDSLANIDQSQDQTVTWAADGYTADDVMTVTLTVASTLLARAGAIRCRAPATAGAATIPASLISALGRIPVGTIQLRLAPRPDRRVQFGLPLVAGGSERAVFDYLFTDMQLVNIR